MPAHLKRYIPLLLVITFLTLLIAWLEWTPPGLLGKMDAIGYAVCHRIPERSFHLAERPLPLCARCSGMYMGVWLGMMVLLGQGRKSGFPSKSKSIFFLVVVILFMIDGLNSYLNFFIPTPILYEPQNWLRLFSGSVFGIAIAAYLAPMVNQTVWLNVTLERSLESWKQIIGLTLGVVLLNLAMLSENPLLVYPLSLIASLTVMLMLSIAYTLAWVLITHRENAFISFNQVKWHVLAGITTALLQIIVIDAVRLALTGSWGVA